MIIICYLMSIKSHGRCQISNDKSEWGERFKEVNVEYLRSNGREKI